MAFMGDHEWGWEPLEPASLCRYHRTISLALTAPQWAPREVVGANVVCPLHLTWAKSKDVCDDPSKVGRHQSPLDHIVALTVDMGVIRLMVDLDFQLLEY